MNSNQVTIVYDVVDEVAFQAGGNPLRYEHHGLKAHTAATYDAVYGWNKMRPELLRLRDVVSPSDRDAIDAVLRLP